MCPDQESDLDRRFRKPLFYPLNYRDTTASSVQAVGLFYLRFGWGGGKVMIFAEHVLEALERKARETTGSEEYVVDDLPARPGKSERAEVRLEIVDAGLGWHDNSNLTHPRDESRSGLIKPTRICRNSVFCHIYSLDY